jgi:hypothetical protein
MTHSIRAINDTGDNIYDFGGRHTFNLSNGNVMTIVRDLTAPGGVERFYVYETADRSTWTLRATITPDSTPAWRMTAAVGPDNDLHIVMIGVNKAAIKYCRMNYSGYAVGAWQSVRAYAASVEVNDLDIDVSADNKIYVTNTYWKGSGAAYGFALHRRGTTWDEVDTVDLHSGNWNRGCESISICFAGTQTVSSIAYTALIIAIGYSQGSTDKGVKIYRPLVKTDGTLRAGLGSTVLSTVYAAGSANPSSNMREGRLVKLFRDPSSGIGSTLESCMQKKIAR